MTRMMILLAAGLVSGMTALVPAASAASCFDLWYERNAIGNPPILNGAPQ